MNINYVRVCAVWFQDILIKYPPQEEFFFLRPHPIPLEIPVPFAGQGVVQKFCATAQCLLTHTPNSELTAMLLSGTASDPTVGIMQQTVGWNPGDLLYTPVLQVRVGHDTVMETDVGLCTSPPALSPVGLETSESTPRSDRRLMSSCCKQNKETW